MSNPKEFAHVVADDSTEYFCPLEIVRSRGRLGPEQLDDCVEAEVVGRYIGNLKVVSLD